MYKNLLYSEPAITLDPNEEYAFITGFTSGAFDG